MAGRRQMLVLGYLAIGILFLLLAIAPAYRTTMVALGVVFLVLALAQWKQQPRPRRRL